jgi:inner membrane transporter RhtA
MPDGLPAILEVMTTTTRPAPTLLSRAPSPVLVLGGIASVQFGSAIAATLFHLIGGGGAVLLRLVSATVVLFVAWRPRVRVLERRQARLALVFGLVLAVMNLAFYHAIERIPLGIAVTIEFVGPLSVAVAGSRRAVDLVWVALAAIGIAALAHGGAHGLDGLGAALALLAGLAWGVYILVNARLGTVFHDGTGVAIAMAVATVVAVPFGAAEGGSALLRPHVLLLGACVGVLSSAIPYSFEFEALKRIPTNVFGVLMSLEPGLAALAGFLVLGQSLGARELGGIALVAVASAGASRRSAPTDPPPIVD